MDLISALRTKDGGTDLAERLERDIIPTVRKKLEHTTDLFPQYTDHSIRHSDAVLTILNWLIPDATKKQLNEWELYSLIAATYMHDLGMIETCPAAPSGPEWESYRADYLQRSQPSAQSLGELERKAVAAFVRDTHHIRSEQYITENRLELGLRATDTEHEAWIVGRVSRGHRKDDLTDPELFRESALGNRVIRLDLLAAYLRLADELDVTSFRTPLSEYSVLHIDDARSVAEWGKHLSLSGVVASNGVILIEGRCTDPEAYLRLLKMEEEIRGKLREIRNAIPSVYASKSGQILQDPIPYHDVKLSLRHEGYFPIVAEFRMQDEAIIDLLMGERLYEERTACIRELLQNAVDTCHEALLLRPRAWQPRITIHEDSEQGVFTVVDNGMGMDTRIVTEYFSRIGLSYYRSAEFAGNFNPISQFGIGILSCFMLAERVEIESKRDGSEAIRLELNSPTKPFVPRKGSRSDPGTEVRLYIKQECKGDFNLTNSARHYAKLVDIPIEVLGDDGVTEAISRKSLIPSVEELTYRLFEPMEIQRWKRSAVERYLRSKDLSDYHEYAEADGIQIGVLLLDELFEDFQSERTRGWSVLHDAGFSSVYQDGFYVSHLRAALMGSTMTWVTVNVTGEPRFDLTLDRSRYAGDNLDTLATISIYGDEFIHYMVR